jgi:hypothetical protein
MFRQLPSEEVAMTDVNDKGFLRRYSAVVLAVWRDDSERIDLMADPTGYAVRAGLPVAAGAAVSVDDRPIAGPLSSENIISAWAGEPGRHVLLLPPAPPVDAGELADDQLASIAAGLLCLIEIV